GSYGVGGALEQSRTTAGDVAMERYAAGDDDAFEALYDSLAGRLYAYLRRHDPRACDDLLQETFLRMHKARGTFVTGAAAVALGGRNRAPARARWGASGPARATGSG